MRNFFIFYSIRLTTLSYFNHFIEKYLFIIIILLINYIFVTTLTQIILTLTQKDNFRSIDEFMLILLCFLNIYDFNETLTQNKIINCVRVIFFF